MRTATITRKTSETDVAVTVNLDGTGAHRISTGIGFYDHMLEQLARHGLFDLDIKTVGDLHIDAHHTVEDLSLIHI
jgi:imidazoleglycerol-phosphate dehydratase